MGKTNTSTPKQPPNAQLFARLSHLYRASSAFAAPGAGTTSGEKTTDPSSATAATATTANLSRFYLSHLRSIAMKSVIRLDPSIKRRICKRCDAFLAPGVSCTERIENKSKNGKKPWADVLIVECNACGAMKRFPVGMDERRTQKRRALKLSNDDGEKGNSGKKPDGKNRNGKNARVFKMPETPAKGVRVGAAGTGGTDSAMETTEGILGSLLLNR